MWFGFTCHYIGQLNKQTHSFKIQMPGRWQGRLHVRVSTNPEVNGNWCGGLCVVVVWQRPRPAVTLEWDWADLVSVVCDDKLGQWPVSLLRKLKCWGAADCPEWEGVALAGGAPAHSQSLLTATSRCLAAGTSLSTHLQSVVFLLIVKLHFHLKCHPHGTTFILTSRKFRP